MIERDKMEARWDKLLLYGSPGSLVGHPVTPRSVPVPFAQTHPELLSAPSPAWTPCLAQGFRGQAPGATHTPRVLLPRGWHV